MTTSFEDLYNQAHAAPEDTQSSAPEVKGTSFEDLYNQAHSDAPATANAKPTDGAEWSDYGRSIAASYHDMGARFSTMGQRFADTFGTQEASDNWRHSAVDAERAAQASRDSMSKGGQDIANATAIPTEGSQSLFGAAYNHPLDTLAIKGGQVATSVAPYLAAGALTGGTGAVALGADVALGAVDQASGSMQAAVSKSNMMTDEELAQASPRFAQLLKDIPDPNAARVKFREELFTTPQLAADLVTGAAAGWITGRTLSSGKGALAGVEKIGEKGVGEAERGALRTMTEQGAANAVGGVTTNYAEQRSEAVSKDATGKVGGSSVYGADPGKMAVAGVNSFVEGSLAAGAPHAVGKAHGAVRGYLDKVVAYEPVGDVGGGAAETAALKATQPPPAQPPAAPAPITPAPVPPPEGGKTVGQAMGLEPVTPPANPAVDAGQTTPETPETLDAQRQAVVEGRKRVMSYPEGTEVPPRMDGLNRLAVDGVTYEYNPNIMEGKKRLTTAAVIRKAHADGSIAEMLNPAHEIQPKEETLARAAEGEPVAAAVTEKPDGTEVEASAGTADVLPAKVAALEQAKAPDETVVVKPVEEVIAARQEPSPAPEPVAEIPQAPDVTLPPEVNNAAVTPEVNPPQRGVAESLGAQAPEVLGPTEIANGSAPPVKPPTRPRKAQDVINAARGITAEQAPAVAPKAPRRTKAPEEQKAGNAGKHERRARTDANRVGVEVATQHKLSPELLKKAAGGDDAAWKEVQKTATRMVEAFNAAAKQINADHAAKNPDRTKLAKATVAKEQVKIPGGYAKNLNPENAPSAGLAMVMEARALIKDGKKGLQRFLTRHEVAHGGDLTQFNAAIHEDRTAEGNSFGDAQKARTLAKKLGGEGEAPTTDIADHSTNPEEILAAKQEAKRLLSGEVTVDEVAPTPRKVTPKKEPGENTVMKKSFSEEREAQAGETRTVAETEKARIAAEALARLAQKDTGVAAPKKAEPAPEPKAKSDLEKEADKLLKGDKFDDADLQRERDHPGDEHHYKKLLDEMADEEHIASGGTIIKLKDGTSLHVEKTVSAREVLNPRSFARRAFGRDRVFMPLVIRRILDVAGDTKVHILADTEHNREAMSVDGRAVHGFYRKNDNEVVVTRSQTDAGNLHTLVHEVGHAATSYAIEADEHLKGNIRALMEHVKAQLANEIIPEREGRPGKPASSHYGFKNEKEFMAEFFGNKQFRENLRGMTVPSELARQLRLKDWHRQTVYSAIMDRLRRAFGLPDKSMTALEAALGLSERAVQRQESRNAERASKGLPVHRVGDERRYGLDLHDMDFHTSGPAMRPVTRGETWKRAFKNSLPGSIATRAADAVGGATRNNLAFTHNILRDIDRKLGTNMGLRLHQLVEGRHSLETKVRDQYAKNARDLDILRRKHGKDYEKLVDIIDEARQAGVDIHKDRSQFTGSVSLTKAGSEAWFNANEPEINRLKANADLWNGAKKALDAFDSLHSEAGIRRIAAHWTNDLVTQHGMDRALDPISQQSVYDLASRFYHKALTKADENLLGLDDPDLIANGGTKAYPSEVVRQMTEARKQFAKEDNTYRPFHREGTHWATAQRDIHYLGNGGEKLSDDVVQFVRQTGESKKAFEDRVKQYIADMQVKHGFSTRDAERVNLDPADLKGAPIEKEAEGVDGARVVFATSYADKAFGGVAAEERVKAMTADDSRDLPFKLTNGKYTVGGVDYQFFNPDKTGAFEPVAQQFDSSGARALSPRLEALAKRLEEQVDFSKMDPVQQRATKKALLEAALLGRTGSSALGSHTIADRKVRGFSKDLVRSYADYVDQAARDIAGSTLQPQIDAVTQKLGAKVTTHKHSVPGGMDEKNHEGRVISEQWAEVQRRYNNAKQNAPNRLVRNLLHATSLDKLANLSFNMVNAMEAPIMGGTQIGGRHGHIPALAAMAKAGYEMGSLGVVGKAAKQTWAARNILADHVDYGKMVAAKGGDFKTVMDSFEKTGIVSPEAEYFFSQESRPQASGPERLLATADRMGRQMTMGVETLNRAITGVAAFRLERERLTKEHKGPLDHAAKRKIEQAALDYAYNTTIDTMGNYSRTNSGSLFTSGTYGPALQFRKYGVKTYSLLGQMMKGAVKGDAEKRHALIGLMGVQLLVAGVSGLPLEPIRLALGIGDKLDDDWGLNENEFEEAMRNMFSGAPPMMREALVHGVGRLAGVDLGGKLGMGNLSGIKLPKSSDTKDLQEWLGETLGGASLSTVAETGKAVFGKVLNPDSTMGDRIAGVAEATPIKIVSDASKAVAGYLNDPETKRGLKKSEQYGFGEAIVKGMGFTPAREASENEQRGINYMKHRNTQMDEGRIKQLWIKAKTGEERSAVIEKMREFNSGVERDARLTVEDLVKYQRSHDKLNKNSVLGQTVKKSEKSTFDKTEKLFGAY